MELEDTRHQIPRREFLRAVTGLAAGVVLLLTRYKHVSAQEPTPPVETSEIPQEGFLGNTALEKVVYTQGEAVKQVRVNYVAYGEDFDHPDHKSVVADVITNPTGITFYHFRRMEEERIFGFRVRADDDIFVAIVEKDCNMIPVFLKRVLFGLITLGSDREFFTEKWNRTRDVNDLPDVLKGISEIEEALTNGKLILYHNFGSRSRSEVVNTIVGGIASSDSLN
jgi:hypothetical protein